MDCSEFSWLSEMDFIESCLTELITDSPLVNNIQRNDSSTSLISTDQEEDFAQYLMMDSATYDEPHPNKLQKTNTKHSMSCFSSSSAIANHNCSSPIILNFGNGNSNPNPKNAKNHVVNPRILNPDEEANVSQVLRSQLDSLSEHKCVETKKKTRTNNTHQRSPSQNHHHIMLERKRREQLSQKFIALSTMVPGLKKMDKSTVLGDAIKYLRHLQERVNSLEERVKKRTVESLIYVNKSQVMLEDDQNDECFISSNSNEKSTSDKDQHSLPEIEARVCNNNQILLKIQCEKQKGVLINLFSLLEKLNLTVVNTNATMLGNLVLDITIVAEMESGFELTVKEVVKRLREAV